MTKEQQDLAWQCLPKEVREEIRRDYKYSCVQYKEYNTNLYKGTIDTMEYIFGNHNLTSDEEPEEMLFVEREKVQDYHKAITLSCEKDKEISEYASGKYQGALYALYHLFGDKCLPDKEPSVQGEPKFPIGSVVRITNNKNPHYGHKGRFGKVITYNAKFNRYAIAGIPGEWEEGDLEPYTEPKKGNKEEESGNNSEIPNQINDNMEEEKELNLCELLKDCEGETFFSLMFGDVTFIKIVDNPNISVGEKPIVTSEGRYLPNAMYQDRGIPTLFPSRVLYEKYPLDAAKAWNEWAEERTPKRWRAKEGEIYWLIPLGGSPILSHKEYFTEYQNKLYEFGNYFRTKELAQQAAEAVRECLMKFHEKNLEK